MDWQELQERLIRSKYYYFHTNNGVLLYGDCSDVMKIFPNECIDLVLTDPPYPKRYSYTYDYLANYCPKLMKNGSSLLTLAGHYALPDIMNKFTNKLKYRWIFCMNQEEGNHARMAMGIEVMWKPVLWYVKKAYPNKGGFIKDMLKVEKFDGVKKKYHKWQQSERWAEFFISKLTEKNDLVLDPFLGSGTTAVVREKLNRKWIGIEINKDYCKIAKERILKESKNRIPGRA